MHLAARWAALVTAALAACATTASASTVAIEHTAIYSGGYSLRYLAAAGERNDVTMEFANGGGHYHSVVRSADAGPVIEPGAGCRALDPHAVECAIAAETREGMENHFQSHRLELGDQDDTIRFRYPSRTESSMGAAVDGGPGADTLTAPPHGGVGGGPGPDHLFAPVTGSAGLHGGPGADVLTGSDRDDYLTGGAGPDRLVGGDGDDRLNGDDPSERILPADAQDSLDAGAGNDALDGGQAVNQTACGPGVDVTIAAQRRDFVPFDCERVAFVVDYEFGIAFDLRPRPVAWRLGSPVFEVPCGELEEPWGYEFAVPCRGSIELREATGRQRLLGRAAVPGRVASVRLTPLGVQLMRRPYGALVTVTVRGHDIFRPNGWTFRLRRPQR
ncbi:MAG TPA: calcium-binding protein [Solirubrobacteraceae bacterium]|nr:calcium-binding protein [Solirubrobacteraceae bacterium]